MQDCIFCKIVSGDIPANKIYEDDFVYAFLDIAPVHKGHTLVIPKKHSRTVFDMNSEDFGKLSEKIHFLAKSIKETMHADGINIMFNIEEAAGQVVFHTHAHIIPRFTDDGLKQWKGGNYKKGEAEQITEKLQKALK